MNPIEAPPALILAGTYFFPFTGETGVTVMRDDCSVVIYPPDMFRLQSAVETSATGTVEFHGVTLDESDLAEIRNYACRMGVLS